MMLPIKLFFSVQSAFMALTIFQGHSVGQHYGGAHLFGTFLLSHLCIIKLSPLVSESSLKGNDSELSDKNVSRKSGATHVRMPMGLAWSSPGDALG